MRERSQARSLELILFIAPCPHMCRSVRSIARRLVVAGLLGRASAPRQEPLGRIRPSWYSGRYRSRRLGIPAAQGVGSVQLKALFLVRLVPLSVPYRTGAVLSVPFSAGWLKWQVVAPVSSSLLVGETVRNLLGRLTPGWLSRPMVAPTWSPERKGDLECYHV